MTEPARQTLVRLQDRLVQLLGGSVEGRPTLVADMLHRSASEAASYWLQLVVSVGIATLGLVLGSTAVIIGAMLVAPLMGPIIGLAMGLATGSPFLVLRSAGRVALSVLVAIGGAALITVLLPFHELNSELLARTTPTVLDLLAAGFCALAGVYASMRPGSDTAATAAGTSIGISLVPPLCASGYGLGTLAWSVSGGAALLFLTNLVAIVVVGTAAFVVAGFGRVDVAALEHAALADRQGAPIATALALRLARIFKSRGGPVLRFLMPVALLAAVYVPLHRALDEVAWEVRVRGTAKDAIGRDTHRVVDSRVHIARHEVDIALVILGLSSDAEAVRARLESEIGRASGVAPHIQVMAVPDATAFAGLESTLLRPQLAPPSPPVLSLRERLEASSALVRSKVLARWPSETVGDPLVVGLGTIGDSSLRIRIVHVGPALGADAREGLERSLQPDLGSVSIDDAFIPSEELTPSGGELKFVAELSAAVRVSATVGEVEVCVTRPAPSAPGPHPKTRDGQLTAEIRGHPGPPSTGGHIGWQAMASPFRARALLAGDHGRRRPGGQHAPVEAPAPAALAPSPNGQADPMTLALCSVGSVGRCPLRGG